MLLQRADNLHSHLLNQPLVTTDSLDAGMNLADPADMYLCGGQPPGRSPSYPDLSVTVCQYQPADGNASTTLCLNGSSTVWVSVKWVCEQQLRLSIVLAVAVSCLVTPLHG